MKARGKERFITGVVDRKGDGKEHISVSWQDFSLPICFS